MPGLSQLELDALCCGHEANADEPSSPMGSALLARKRHRQAHGELQAPSTLEDIVGNRDHTAAGLSQADLDELSVQGQPAEDPATSSPLGSSLRAAKNRRRWGAPVAAQEDFKIEQEVASDAPTLRCPASWGNTGSGLSQAELDAMCTDIAPEATPEVACMAGKAPIHDYILEETPLSRQTSPFELPPAKVIVPSPMQVTVTPASPTHSSQQANPGFSPPMRRRRGSKKADAENQITPFGSPARGSPGKAFGLSPGKSMDMQSPGEIHSPVRRSPAWKANPLSPVGLN